MSRTRAAVALSLVLFPTVNVVAGPPVERSSAMKLDKVADCLRQYQQSKTDEKRVEWLNRLAPSHDPRVKAALEAAAKSDSSVTVRVVAILLLAEHYDSYRHIFVPPRRGFIRPPHLPPSGPPET